MDERLVLRRDNEYILYVLKFVSIHTYIFVMICNDMCVYIYTYIYFIYICILIYIDLIFSIYTYKIINIHIHIYIYGCGSKCKVWIKPPPIQTFRKDLIQTFDPDLWNDIMYW